MQTPKMTTAVRTATPDTEADARARLAKAVQKRAQAKTAGERQQVEAEIREAELAFMRAGAQTK